MRQVSTQEELRAALLAREAEIQVTADFDVSAQQNVTYTLLLHSAPGAGVHTLSKTAGFSGSLLRVSGGGALTLENLILDGAAAGSYLENGANRTLVQVAGGSLHLTSGAVLQNNSSFQEGGGLYLAGDASYVNTLLMDGNAVIRGCNSRTSGGGLTAALRNNGDSVRLAGAALIEENTAANGAGVYLRSYLAEVGGAVSIEEGVQIRNNRASSNGGGVYCSSFSTGGAPPLSLTVEGEVDISSNEAASGGGLYFYSANPGDRLTLTGSVRVAANTVTGSGGGVYLSAPRDGVSLSIQGASILDNRAVNGGGVYLRATAGGTLEVMGQTILSGNVAAGAASGAGGGLWVQNVSGALTAVFTDASILSNRAAGNGGGLFLSNSGSAGVQMSGGAIRQNTAGVSGGGIYLIDSGGAAGTLDMDGVTVSDNTAGTSGGGLYSAQGTGRITIRGGSEITENNAASGGGIYRTGDRVLSLEGVTITLNTADTGQGVYNDGPLELGPVAVIPDRIYLPDQAAVPTIVEHLSRDSVVQLERSDYVTPNQTGTPIVVARSELELVGEDAVVFRTPPTGFVGWRFLVSDDRHQILLTPAEYHLYYENTLGGENPNPIRYTEFTPTITLLPLANTPGDRFLGWYDAAEGGNRVTQIPRGTTGDKTLYAHWQMVEYAVTYYGNDAGGPGAEHMPPPQQVRGGESALLSGERPTRTGYAFVAWNTDPGGMGTAYPPGGTIPNVLADISLYAQWERVEYTLTYHGNDEGGPPVQNIPDRNIFYAEEVFPLSNAVPTREGCRFTGWNTRPDGGGAAYQPGDSFDPAAADADLYAQWAALPPTVHLLTYEANDAGGPPAQWVPYPAPVEDGQSILLSDAIPTRTGNRFLGWNDAPDGSGVTYRPGQTVGPFYAGLAIYAQWQQIWQTLTYHGNDEAGPPAQWVPFPQPVPEGQVISLPNVIPTREDYRFTGWNTLAEGGGAAYQPGDPFGPIFSEADLYAQWTALPPGTHTLSYHGNDSGGPAAQDIPGPVPVPDGQSVTLSDMVPTREGFAFTGWNTDPGGMGRVYRPGETIPDVRMALDLYAQWLPLPLPVCYTLTYCGNDAGGPPACCMSCSQQVRAGQYAGIPCCAPRRNGYRFVAWNTDPCGMGQTVCPGQTLGPVMGDVRLYAQWHRLPPPRPRCTRPGGLS